MTACIVVLAIALGIAAATAAVLGLAQPSCGAGHHCRRRPSRQRADLLYWLRTGEFMLPPGPYVPDPASSPVLADARPGQLASPAWADESAAPAAPVPGAALDTGLLGEWHSMPWSCDPEQAPFTVWRVPDDYQPRRVNGQYLGTQPLIASPTHPPWMTAGQPALRRETEPAGLPRLGPATILPAGRIPPDIAEYFDRQAAGPGYPCCKHCEHLEPNYDPAAWRHETPCQHGCDDDKPVLAMGPAGCEET